MSNKNKKLLFIMDNFPLGGIAKSLLSLLNEIESKYDIDLLLMEQEGLFIPMIPKSVNLLPERIEREFRNPHPKYVFKNFKTLKFGRFIKWCGYSLSCCFARLTGGLYKHVQTMDVYLGKHSKPLDTHYDCAIAYAGGRCIYYLAENVNADIKIGYVHSDYLNNEVDFMLKKTDKIYYPKMDYLVTISNKCLQSLKTAFPEIKEKFVVIENICSCKMIDKMALSGESFNDDFKGFRIISLVRFDIYTKGLDFAIEASKILKSKNKDFRWYLLGSGYQESKLRKMIEESGLEKEFIILGAKTNPYAYLKDSDIYVQPSRVEGKSVSLDEAKALKKPIVVTNFSSVKDQFTDEKTALIAEMNAESVAQKILRLMEDENLRKTLSYNLSLEKVGNEEQAEIFESLFNR